MKQKTQVLILAAVAAVLAAVVWGPTAARLLHIGHGQGAPSTEHGRVDGGG